MIVSNVKNSNGRAHGIFRRLLWPLENAEDAIESLRSWLAAIQFFRGKGEAQRPTFTKLLSVLEDRLRVVADRLWPKRMRHITLYSTRHMFAAAAKEVCTRIEVAALMGHAVDQTAIQHYARPRKG